MFDITPGTNQVDPGEKKRTEKRERKKGSEKKNSTKKIATETGRDGRSIYPQALTQPGSLSGAITDDALTSPPPNQTPTRGEHRCGEVSLVARSSTSGGDQRGRWMGELTSEVVTGEKRQQPDYFNPILGPPPAKRPRRSKGGHRERISLSKSSGSPAGEERERQTGRKATKPLSAR